jgi:hypothetical protein
LQAPGPDQGREEQRLPLFVYRRDTLAISSRTRSTSFRFICTSTNRSILSRTYFASPVSLALRFPFRTRNYVEARSGSIISPEPLRTRCAMLQAFLASRVLMRVSSLRAAAIESLAPPAGGPPWRMAILRGHPRIFSTGDVQCRGRSAQAKACSGVSHIVTKRRKKKTLSRIKFPSRASIGDENIYPHIDGRDRRAQQGKRGGEPGAAWWGSTDSAGAGTPGEDEVARSWSEEDAGGPR